MNGQSLRSCDKPNAEYHYCARR